jgi:hypothetical protein
LSEPTTNDRICRVEDAKRSVLNVLDGAPSIVATG